MGGLYRELRSYAIGGKMVVRHTTKLVGRGVFTDSLVRGAELKSKFLFKVNYFKIK